MEGEKQQGKAKIVCFLLLGFTPRTGGILGTFEGRRK